MCLRAGGRALPRSAWWREARSLHTHPSQAAAAQLLCQRLCLALVALALEPPVCELLTTLGQGGRQ